MKTVDGYSCGIDSFTFETPVSNCSFISNEILRILTTLSLDDGDIVEEKRHPFYIDDGCIKLRFMIVSRFGNDFLSCTLSTKLFPLVNLDYVKDFLDERTFKICLKYLERYFIINNKSLINFFDVDFAVDGFFNINDYDSLRSFTMSNPLGSVFFSKRSSLHSKEVTGFQFNKRNASSIKHPFFKIYNKSVELQTRSSKFMQRYNIIVPNNLIRLEVTLKNKRHLERYGLPNDFSLLSLSVDRIFSVIKLIYSSTLPVIPLKDNSDVVLSTYTPVDQALINIFYELLTNGYSLQNCLSFANVQVTHSPTAASRLKKKFTFLYGEALKLSSKNIRLTSKDAFLL